MVKRHNVFISNHVADQEWKCRFVDMMGDRIVDKSVNLGDLDANRPATEQTLQSIRESHIASASVTVVLIGRCTWQRKYVDWEIGASLRHTRINRRCGLLGILLPDHPNFRRRPYNPHLIPQRLALNCAGDNPYARTNYWTQQPGEIQSWIRKAFNRSRRQPDPDTGLPLFADNRTTDPLRGWQ